MKRIPGVPSPFFPGIPSFRETIQNLGETVGFLKERWLKRMENQPLEEWGGGTHQNGNGSMKLLQAGRWAIGAPLMRLFFLRMQHLCASQLIHSSAEGNKCGFEL